MSEQAAAAAGWYADPHGGAHGQLRYWDGTTWTEHTKSPGYQGDGYAWAVAVSPLVWALVALVQFFAKTTTEDSQTLTVVVGLGFYLTMCMLDVQVLRRRAGADQPPDYTVLLPPWYLLSRSQRAGSTPLMAVLWLVCALIAIGAAFATPKQYDAPMLLETRLAADIGQRADLEEVRVSCPTLDDVVRVGEEITCTARAGLASVLVFVTFEDDAEFSWEIP